MEALFPVVAKIVFAIIIFKAGVSYGIIYLTSDVTTDEQKAIALIESVRGVRTLLVLSVLSIVALCFL